MEASDDDDDGGVGLEGTSINQESPDNGYETRNIPVLKKTGTKSGILKLGKRPRKNKAGFTEDSGEENCQNEFGYGHQGGKK